MGEDPFAAFTSETAPPLAAPDQSARARRGWSRLAVPKIVELVHRAWPQWALPGAGRLVRRIAIVTLSLMLLAAAGYAVIRDIRAQWLAPPATGVLSISSNPSGAEVLIDGIRRGVTPLTLDVLVGVHRLTLRSGATSKDISIFSKKNVEVVQNVELAPPGGTTGALSVSSDPPGLKIAIDGTPRGTTPALIEQLTPGDHLVTLSGKSGTAERSVLITAGGTASLMVSKPAVPASGGVGSLTVSSPIDVQLFEGETLIGSSRSARLFLPAGRHTITAVNAALGFERSLVADVKPGAAASLAVPIPNGALSVNAQPWAEVFVDGRSVGETPIGNYSLPIGSHDVLFRHPQLGERRQTVEIAVGRTARVGVDLRK